MVCVQIPDDEQQIDEGLSIPKYKQLASIIITNIRKGVLKKCVKLPSVNQMSIDFLVSRDTVSKAYQFLLQKGYIYSENRRGYFVSENHQDVPANVCMIAGQLNEQVLHIYKLLIANKKILSPQLHLHHYSIKKLAKILSNNVKNGYFEYFVLFPHLQASDNELMDVLKMIPSEKLIILDKAFPFSLNTCSVIHKNYEEDLGKFYASCRKQFEKFWEAQLILPNEYFPAEGINIFKNFCQQNSINYKLTDEPDIVVRKGSIYVVMSDQYLVKIIKSISELGYELDKEIGILLLYDSSYTNLLSTKCSSFSYDLDEIALKIIEVIKNKKHINHVLKAKMMI